MSAHIRVKTKLHNISQYRGAASVVAESRPNPEQEPRGNVENEAHAIAHFLVLQHGGAQRIQPLNHRATLFLRACIQCLKTPHEGRDEYSK